MTRVDCQIMAELRADFERQMLAEFMLGAKGEHFAGDEWERRADEIQARCHLAEARLVAEMEAKS